MPPHVRKSFEHMRPRRARPLRFHEFRQPHHQQADDHRDVTQAIHEKAHRHSEFAISKPATDGPITRAPFTMELLSEIAFIKSSRLVISTMNACRAGMSNAIASPRNAAITKIIPGRDVWLHTSAAKANASTIIAVCVHSTMLRLECWSAIEPPQIENNSIGAELDRRDHSRAAISNCVISYTSQPCAVFCIQVPMSETNWPLKNSRKFRCRSAENVCRSINSPNDQPPRLPGDLFRHADNFVGRFPFVQRHGAST